MKVVIQNLNGGQLDTVIDLRIDEFSPKLLRWSAMPRNPELYFTRAELRVLITALEDFVAELGGEP